MEDKEMTVKDKVLNGVKLSEDELGDCAYGHVGRKVETIEGKDDISSWMQERTTIFEINNRLFEIDWIYSMVDWQPDVLDNQPYEVVKTEKTTVVEYYVRVEK